MTRKCVDLPKLQHLDETSDEYAELVSHLDSCDACQSRLDTDVMSSDTAELIEELQQSHFDSEPDFSSEFTAESTTAGESVTRFLQPPTHPELLGRLGRYDIERVVGQGGMGVVFKAMDTELHRVVAVKALAEHLATNAAARRRFAREAQAAAAVLHPNVIPIYNVQPDGASPYLVMQYVEGESLQRRVDRTGPLGVVDTLRIAKQTCEALAAAHDQGLVHRDVKPSNILLEEQTDRAVLSDFGLARSADDASLTQTGIVAGTPHYMSPEQAKGREITYASDVFALGSVLYFVLSGHPPFRAESAMGVLHCICTAPHRSVGQINNDVPLELTRLVDRCLAKKPSRRPGSAQQVATELEDILSRIHQGKIRLDRPSHVGRTLSLVAIAAAVCLIFGLIASYPQLKQSGTVSRPATAAPADSKVPIPTPNQTPPSRTPSLSPKDESWIQSELAQRRALTLEIDVLSQTLGGLMATSGSLNPSHLPSDALWESEIIQLDASLDEIQIHLDQYDFETHSAGKDSTE